MSTKSCQIAMALRPRDRPSSMASRKGALAQTDRLWLGCGSGPLNSAPKSVITSLAGFAGVGSVITSFLAGFGRLRPHPPGCPTGIPAALRYAPMVSRRMCTARSIRRSDHPRRPKAITCCLFSSFKTLLTSTEGIALTVGLNVPSAGLSLAGFQVIMYGRFWVITEGHKKGPNGSTNATVTSHHPFLPTDQAVCSFEIASARTVAAVPGTDEPVPWRRCARRGVESAFREFECGKPRKVSVTPPKSGDRPEVWTDVSAARLDALDLDAHSQ